MPAIAGSLIISNRIGLLIRLLFSIMLLRLGFATSYPSF